MNCYFCKTKMSKISLKKFEYSFCSNCKSYFKLKKNIYTYFLELLYFLFKFETGKYYQYQHLLFDEINLKNNKKYIFLKKNIKILKNTKALDLSGEPFKVCLSLKKVFRDLTFSIYNKKSYNLLKKKYNCNIVYYDLEKNNKFYKNNSFNLIIAWMCLYYSKNLKEVLARIAKLSKKKSTIILSSPEPTLKTIKYFDNTHIYPPNILFSKKL